jgi:hypothetical protein
MNSISGGPPVESIIICRADDKKSCAGTLVIKIPPTTAEHNMIMALLQELRHRYPGAWYCAKEWELKQYPQKIGSEDRTVPMAVPVKADHIVEKIKGVTAASMGIDSPGELGDVPL